MLEVGNRATKAPCQLPTINSLTNELNCPINLFTSITRLKNVLSSCHNDVCMFFIVLKELNCDHSHAR